MFMEWDVHYIIALCERACNLTDCKRLSKSPDIFGSWWEKSLSENLPFTSHPFKLCPGVKKVEVAGEIIVQFSVLALQSALFAGLTR